MAAGETREIKLYLAGTARRGARSSESHLASPDRRAIAARLQGPMGRIVVVTESGRWSGEAAMGRPAWATRRDPRGGPL
jgi:hypothetical protein